MKRVIGFTGTHGKTTATSMMAQVSLAAGRDDGWLLGAPVLGVGAQGHWGEGDLLLEVDESYGTFGELHPYALGISNVEPDHLDYYGSLDALETRLRRPGCAHEWTGRRVVRRPRVPGASWPRAPAWSWWAATLTRRGG